MESSSKLDEEEMTFLGRVKIDLDTPLEKGLTYATYALLFGAYLCFHIGVFGGKRSPPEPAFLKGLPYFLGLAAITFALRRGTDNYYLLDIRRRLVMYHFRFLTWESTEPAFRFDDIRRMVLRIETRRDKHSTWNEYQLQIVRSIGEVVEFSDWVKEADELRSRGEKLAKLFRRQLETDDYSESNPNPPLTDGSKVWFHLGSIPVTEHRLAVSLGILFLLFIFGVGFLAALR